MTERQIQHLEKHVAEDPYQDYGVSYDCLVAVGSTRSIREYVKECGDKPDLYHNLCDALGIKPLLEADELHPLWEQFFAANVNAIDTGADKGGAHWESVCVGWCMANGLDADEAYEFYEAQVKKRVAF